MTTDCKHEWEFRQCRPLTASPWVCKLCGAPRREHSRRKDGILVGIISSGEPNDLAIVDARTGQPIGPVTAARIEFDRDLGWAPRIYMEIQFSPVQVTGYAEVECKCGHCGEVVYASETMAGKMEKEGSHDQ